METKQHGASDMKTQMKGGASRLRTDEIARWKHQNVYTFVCADKIFGMIGWFSIEQLRTYSSATNAGEAHTYESSDLASAIAGLTLAKKCIHSVPRWRKRCEAWPFEFDPVDRVIVDRDVDLTHPNLIYAEPDGWIRTLIFENATPSNLLIHKVSQYRVWPWDTRYARTRFLELEHLDDAINGLAKAGRFLQRRERSLWFDHSRQLFK
jgi:hypothetical protein